MLIAAVIAILPVSAQATTTADTSSTVNVELKDTQIKNAIDILFKGRGLSYTIDPNVVGRVVEMKITGVSFKQALDALCEAAGLGYTINDGVYQIYAGPPKGAGAVRTVVQQGTTQPQSVSPPPAARSAPPPAQPAASAQPAQGDEQMERAQAAPAGNVFVSQTASPVYYTQPSYPAVGGWNGPGCGGPGFGQVGNVGFVGGGGCGGPFVISNPTLFWTRDFMPPPPPGYVNPELQRFLQTEYATRSRQYIVPIY